KKSDKINHRVGFKFLKKIGDYVHKNEDIILIYHNNHNLDLVIKQLYESINISQNKVNKNKLIYEIL
ncbi:MAG: pyrimidine-nucleoside phosphorylase, partial [Deferribacterota bacterium]|nr:pyrimidine-nucleoside phosphorylase [Deferribacterota bacterium]